MDFSGRMSPIIIHVVAMLVCLLAPFCSLHSAAAAQEDGEEALPHIFVSILARNSAHLLSNFFGYLEQLDYPKDRISVWIRSDHNEDSTPTVLEQWCGAAEEHYFSVDCHTSTDWIYPTRDAFSMPEKRYLNVATLRQTAMDTARKVGADYLFSVDTDCFLVNPRTLQLLMEQKKTIIAPMLNAPAQQAYSNFWMDQDSGGYYKRHEDYLSVLKRIKTGCIEVPVVLAAYLIQLSSPATQGLVYHPPPSTFTGPVDDVVQLAFSAKTEEIGMFILNTEFFGYILKPETYSSMAEAAQKFMYLKLKSLVNNLPILCSHYLPQQEKPKTLLGVDNIYMIGLARRPERRNRMVACLEELQLNYTMFDAVDGRLLNASYVEELGIRYMPNWRDPWGNRTMTFGEVGCFLSHYTIWNRVISEGLDRVLILEDDIDFEMNFKEDLVTVLEEAEEYTPTWDLIYVGRKRLHFDSEMMVDGASQLLHPHYSYWTLGYLLSIRGARKLLAADPFQNLLPVDEYFPILFGEHPRKDWAKHYLHQTLEVYSAEPLLVYPTYYVGDEGWYSDTEPSLEVLNQIRSRKKEEERQYLEKMREANQHKDEVKNKAMKRQIEQLKMKKLVPKSEL